MPKSLYIDPESTLRPAEHEIKFPEIPVMQYKKTVKDELEEGNFSREDLLHIYRDMFTIREFETMLFQVRTAKHYNGVDYLYTGPAHLYVGQEAAAVGMAYSLTHDDQIFGSHRSHGEVLAKGFNAIRNLPEKELDQIMREFNDGALLKVVEKENTLPTPISLSRKYRSLHQISLRNSSNNDTDRPALSLDKAGLFACSPRITIASI